jgi:hypothetical protein
MTELENNLPSDTFVKTTDAGEFYLLGCRLDGSQVYKKHTRCLPGAIPRTQSSFRNGRHELASRFPVLKINPVCEVAIEYFAKFPELSSLTYSPYFNEMTKPL